ncbi:hypothetical protein [Roseibium limicola]|uniref:Uncharacterized protein n=1 Tax=Roseibium limicola TaxID=2816037 RepID=A0A939EN42_9HYPH|nr:hypothetical protein [Roseibium limicola]MBO0344927.1 hypothetical protein [Roseibium limicola]
MPMFKTFAASTLAAAMLLLPATPAQAEGVVDFNRFLATPAGAAGLAAAVVGLGHCDTPLSWGAAWDDEIGDENNDHLFVACQYIDASDEEMYDKSVVAKFNFWDGKPTLASLTYLP